MVAESISVPRERSDSLAENGFRTSLLKTYTSETQRYIAGTGTGEVFYNPCISSRAVS